MRVYVNSGSVVTKAITNPARVSVDEGKSDVTEKYPVASVSPGDCNDRCIDLTSILQARGTSILKLVNTANLLSESFLLESEPAPISSDDTAAEHLFEG